MGPIIQRARRRKEERNEKKQAGSPHLARGNPQAGELSPGRASGYHQPASIVYMPSFKPAPALVRRELREGSAGQQTSTTDTHTGCTGRRCSKLVSNREAGRLPCGFCKYISSTSKSSREPARAQKRDSCLAETAWVSTRHWTKLLTALRSPGTRPKVSPGHRLKGLKGNSSLNRKAT